MDKCKPPNPDNGESWLSIRQPATRTDPRIPASPKTQFTWETKLDRLLIRIAPLLGRDPLSTLVGACFGLGIMGSAPDLPAAWLSGAAIVVLGRMINER